MKRKVKHTLGLITLVAVAALAAGMPALLSPAPPSASPVGANFVRPSPAAVPAMSYAGVSDEPDAPASNASPYIENLFSVELSPSASPIPTPSAPPAATGAGFGITVLSPGGAPKRRVLIYHTHTYEAYTRQPDEQYEETERWRTADSRYNMVRVGAELAALLTAQGFEVTHDATAFEPPDLAGAYARSLQMLTSRLEAGERYDLYIDLHRDAYIASQTGANTVTVGDTEVARLMLLIGKGEGQTSEGFSEKPDWQQNLNTAQAITDALNAQREGLCKSVRVKSGRFNQHIDTGCVLVEAGNNYNTLSEALAAMPYLADAIAEVLEGGAVVK